MPKVKAITAITLMVEKGVAGNKMERGTPPKTQTVKAGTVFNLDDEAQYMELMENGAIEDTDEDETKGFSLQKPNVSGLTGAAAPTPTKPATADQGNTGTGGTGSNNVTKDGVTESGSPGGDPAPKGDVKSDAKAGNAPSKASQRPTSELI